jgi:hypothetical protein
MAIGINFDADLARAVADLPGSFIWKAGTYAAVVTPVRSQADLGPNGVLIRKAFDIHVQTSLFSAGARPVQDDTVTVGGVNCSIDSTSTDEADAGMILSCIEDTSLRK